MRSETKASAPFRRGWSPRRRCPDDLLQSSPDLEQDRSVPQDRLRGSWSTTADISLRLSRPSGVCLCNRLKRGAEGQGHTTSRPGFVFLEVVPDLAHFLRTLPW